MTKFTDKVGGHFLALDAEGSFARADLKGFKRVTAAGVKPALIVAEGGAPIAVNSDGNLYSGLRSLVGAKAGGGLTRISPDGKQQPFAPDLKATVEKLGISGVATGPEGSRPLTPATRAATIEGVLKRLEEGYVFPGVAQKMAEAVHERAKKGAYDGITSGEELERPAGRRAAR